MIALHSPNTPAPSNDFDRLMALIALVGDPKASAERMKQLTDTAAQASGVVASADAVNAGFEKERKKMAAERAAHTAQIDKERAQFDTECVRRERQIKDTEAATARLQAEAQAARDEAARLTEDLRLRVERVRSAAA